jgi:hypothetical protein
MFAAGSIDWPGAFVLATAIVAVGVNGLVAQIRFFRGIEWHEQWQKIQRLESEIRLIQRERAQ